MKESERILHLFEDLYNGNPWIDVTILPTLQSLSAQQADTRIFPNWNTIWEITNHMIAWRNNVLQRMHGEVLKTPAHNYIVPVRDTSASAWHQTLNRLEDSQKAWVAFIQKCKTTSFDNIYPGNSMTYYEHIQGILQHDAYHLGQIVIMAKQV